VAKNGMIVPEYPGTLTVIHSTKFVGKSFLLAKNKKLL
jgi:hypothetical protein